MMHPIATNPNNIMRAEEFLRDLQEECFDIEMDNEEEKIADDDFLRVASTARGGGGNRCPHQDVVDKDLIKLTTMPQRSFLPTRPSRGSNSISSSNNRQGHYSFANAHAHLGVGVGGGHGLAPVRQSSTPNLMATLWNHRARNSKVDQSVNLMDTGAGSYNFNRSFASFTSSNSGRGGQQRMEDIFLHEDSEMRRNYRLPRSMSQSELLHKPQSRRRNLLLIFLGVLVPTFLAMVVVRKSSNSNSSIAGLRSPAAAAAAAIGPANTTTDINGTISGIVNDQDNSSENIATAGPKEDNIGDDNDVAAGVTEAENSGPVGNGTTVEDVVEVEDAEDGPNENDDDSQNENQADIQGNKNDNDDDDYPEDNKDDNVQENDDTEEELELTVKQAQEADLEAEDEFAQALQEKEETDKLLTKAKEKQELNQEDNMDEDAPEGAEVVIPEEEVVITRAGGAGGLPKEVTQDTDLDEVVGQAEVVERKASDADKAADKAEAAADKAESLAGRAEEEANTLGTEKAEELAAEAEDEATDADLKAVKAEQIAVQLDEEVKKEEAAVVEALKDEAAATNEPVENKDGQ